MMVRGTSLRFFAFVQVLLLCLCGGKVAFAENFSVNNATDFDVALGGIIANNDNDNTILVNEQISIDGSLTWPSSDKRIFIQTNATGELTFGDTVQIPPNVQLVIESANVVFGEDFVISSNIEIKNSAAASTTVLSDDLVIDNGLFKISGNRSTLTVNSIGTLTPTLPTGTGTFQVNEGAQVIMTGTSDIVLDGDVLFDNSRLNQATGTLLNAGSGRIDFDNGSVVTSAGTLNAGGGVFVNDNSVLNVAGANSTLNITGGGLYFSNNSTLGISLNSAGNSGKIDAGNGIVALNGNLLVTPEYGVYNSAPITSNIITSTGNISGNFSNVSLSSSRFGTLDIDSTHTNITFNPNLTPYSNFTQTLNEYSVGQTFDAIHQSQLANFAPLMQATWNMNDADLRALYNDLSGEIRAHTMAMPLANPGRMAFDRVGWASHTGHVFFGPQYRLASSGSRRATWLRPYYIDNSAESDGNASKYVMDGYGFVGGIDQALTGGQTAIGVMLGYGRPELKSRSNKAELDDFVIGGYIASRVIEMFELKLWGGYGYQYYDMNRQINYLGTQQSLKSNFKGHTGTVSAELTRPIYVLFPGIPRLVVKPSVGYDYTYLQQKAGDETGSHVVALAYDKTEIERHIGRAGLSAEYGDSARSLYGGAHYKYLLGGDEVYYSQASFIGGGPAFVVQSADLGKAFISANIGLQINLSDDRSRLLFVDYNVDFGDNDTRYQTATFGLQQTF